MQWQQRFSQRGLPLLGDDIKSQVGATIVHRVLTDLFRKRGVRLDRTYQLNFGGNTDFLNMLERERLESKKISKTQAVTSQLGHPMRSDQVHVGPSDYVPGWKIVRFVTFAWRDDLRKRSVKLRGKARSMGLSEFRGVVIDAIRCAKLAIDRGIGGAPAAPASYFMKSPPIQLTDEQARRAVEEFIEGIETDVATPASPSKVDIAHQPLKIVRAPEVLSETPDARRNPGE